MIEPEAAWLGAMVKRECYNINPEVAQGRMARVLAAKHKIEPDRYREEDDKGRQDSESSFHVESAKILADRQCLHLQQAVCNEITGEREKYPQPNPAKQNVELQTNEVIGENQNHTDAAQAIERRQMSLASVHRLLLKRTAYACVDQFANTLLRRNDNLTIRANWDKHFH